MITNLPTKRIFHVQLEILNPWIKIIDPKTGLKFPEPKREISYDDTWFDEKSIKKEFPHLYEILEDIEFEYFKVQTSDYSISIVAEWY